MTNVLVVCTGNVIRSPAAAALLRHRLDGGVVVASAGTAAATGREVDPYMSGLVGAAGAEMAADRPQQVTADLVRRADLVLTMTKEHRSVVCRLDPTALTRSFTLLEAARLASTVRVADLPEGGDSTRLTALVEVLPAQRPFHLGERDDDVADPYGRRHRAFRTAFTAIDGAVASFVGVLRAR